MIKANSATFLTGQESEAFSNGVKDLVPEYLAACRESGILQARIIHGKGTGALKRTVHAILAKLPEVASFYTAEEQAGGWGATIVELRSKVTR